MATKLGLYELLGPFFLAGFTLPKEADDLLAFLGVDELDMTCDDTAVVCFGSASFGGQGGALPKDVRILLPKIVFEYSQGDVYTRAPVFRLKSCGQSGFFGVADAQAGELICMQPDVAIYKGGAFGLSLGPVILDLSANSTPPEILSLYGTDDAFTGIYAKKFRIFVNFGERLFSFAVGLDDLLYSINEGWVSLEGDLSVFGPDVNFSIDVQAYEDGAGKEYNEGEVGSTYADAKPGCVVLKQGSWLQVLMLGGVPPYQNLAIEFRYDDANGAPQVANLTGQLDATGRNLQLGNLPVPYGELVFTATDSHIPPQQAVRRIELLAYAPAAVQPGLPAPTTVYHRVNAAWVETPNAGRVTHVPSPTGTLEVLQVSGQLIIYTIKAELFHNQGDPQPFATIVPINGQLAVDVPPGKTIYVKVTVNEGMSNPSLLDEYFDVWFDYERPRIDEFPSVASDYADNFASRPHKEDAMFTAIQPPVKAVGELDGRGAALLYDWLSNRLQPQNNEKVVEIIGYASYENDPSKENYNYRLSKRRLAVVYALIEHYNDANPPPSHAVKVVSQVVGLTPQTKS